jgi:glycosyltransferase involved in cell wall biosynthesis
MTVVLVGTEPGGGHGGIQTALEGFQGALDAAEVPYETVVSHRVVSTRHKLAIAAEAARETARVVGRLRAEGRTPVVYAHAGGWPSIARKATILAAARAGGARTVLHLHVRVADGEGALRQRAGRHLLRDAVRVAHAVTVPTRWWRERLLDLQLGRPIEVVSNPLPSDLEAAARHPHPRPIRDKGEPLRVLTLARLVEGKGIDDAIRAVARSHCGAHLTVAGDGTARPQLEGLARRLLPPERVRFPGWLSGAAARDAYRAADVFCLPTTHDTFGMVLVEAMAHGLPVLARRWGPIPDVVPDGVAGTLVTEPVVDQLAGAIDAMTEEPRRHAMGDRGRQWVIDQLGQAKIGAHLRQVLERVGSA